MKVTLLEEPPESGSVEEHWFDAEGDCTWVLFEPEEGEPWAGVFGCGSFESSDDVALFGDDRHIFVLAAGQGYIVDELSRTVVHRTESDYLADAIGVPDRDFVVLADFQDLCLLGSDGQLTDLGRIADDGIIFEQADSECVTGTCTLCPGGDDTYEFRLDLNTRAVQVQTESVNQRLNRITRECLEPIAKERLAELMTLATPEKKDPIARALAAEYSETDAQDIAFHLTDWSGDCAFLLALLLHPDRFSDVEIRSGIMNFLIHAPNHIAAAAKLYGFGIQDVWSLGQLVRDDDEEFFSRRRVGVAERKASPRPSQDDGNT